jgi:integrase/recombinase XerD
MEQTLKSSDYIVLPGSFKEWLGVLNYAKVTVDVLPVHIKEFLQYQEQQGNVSLETITMATAQSFIEHLRQTPGKRTCKPLSAGHLNKHVQALNLLSRYLKETGKANAGFRLERIEDARSKPAWLTKAEIQALYEVTGDSVLGIRDRAMLSVYYGCGLRLNEGAGLELKDIIGDKKLLHVRKGKHYKERYVPIAARSYEAIRLYVDYGRPQLLQQHSTGAVFIDANKGRPMQKQSLYVRIKQLVKRAGIKKKVGTHTLRHSIATHLLQSGMKLEKIQGFLGHSSLDSTQLYTHLSAEATAKADLANEQL